MHAKTREGLLNFENPVILMGIPCIVYGIWWDVVWVLVRFPSFKPFDISFSGVVAVTERPKTCKNILETLGSPAESSGTRQGARDLSKVVLVTSNSNIDHLGASCEATVPSAENRDRTRELALSGR